MRKSNSSSCYLWYEQFSLEQVKKVQEVQRSAHHLEPHIARSARYCLRQIGQSDARCTTVHAAWNGSEPENISIRILSLKDLYLEVLYSQALLELEQRMPRFGEVSFEDGDRIGERRIVFPHTSPEQACEWLTRRMYFLSSQPSLTVRPTVRASKRTMSWNQREQWWVQVYVSDAEVTTETVERVVADVQAGNALVDEDSPGQRFPWEGIRERMVCLSLPELVFLNWEESRKPAGPLEEALWNALKKPDIAAIKKALECGADPNRLDPYGDTALATLISDYANLWINRQDLDEGVDISHYPNLEQLIDLSETFVAHGADVNLVGPNGTSAMHEAAFSSDVRLVERLLDLGGRVDAREPYEHPGTLSIWGAAYRRCDERDEWHHDTSVVDLLEARHGNPYEGIRDETPPS
jgi:hypothetical protein